MKSMLGVNLEELADWNRSWVFVNAAKTGRRFGSPAAPWDGAAKLGPDGWPSGDFGLVVMSAQTASANGTYRLSVKGRCQVHAVACPASVKNLAYDAGTGRTTADVVLEVPAASAEGAMTLAFTGAAGGVTGLEVLRPAYADDSGVFTHDFLKLLAPFGVIRFMDYNMTNGHPVTGWKDRCTPADPLYTLKGGPLEHAAALCNAAGADLWWCFGYPNDDDYRARAAELIARALRPDLNVYVEHANEVWNGSFPQFDQSVADAAKDPEVAGLNPWYASYNHTAKKCVQLGQTFAAAFDRVCGPGSLNTRVRPVLATQGANPAVLDAMLQWIVSKRGPVKDFVYAVAVAPYFGNDPAVMDRDGVTADGVIRSLQQQAGATAWPKVLQLHESARRHGVRSICYEMGVDLGQYDKAVGVKAAAQDDPRVQAVCEGYIDAWFAGAPGVAEVANWYNLCSGWRRTGYWGLTDQVSRADRPKYRAAAAAAARHPFPAAPPPPPSTPPAPAPPPSPPTPAAGTPDRFARMAAQANAVLEQLHAARAAAEKHVPADAAEVRTLVAAEEGARGLAGLIASLGKG